MLYRTFTTREKVLFVFFGILLVGAVYYFLVFNPVVNQKTIIQNTIYSQQEEADTLQIKVSELTKMKKELETLPAASELKPLKEYDNVRGVMEYLNGIMADADDFSISFANVDNQEKFVRRTLNINFDCASDETARPIIDSIFDAPFRSQVSDFSLSYGQEGNCSVSITITFFEIQADKNLPTATTVPVTEEAVQ